MEVNIGNDDDDILVHFAVLKELSIPLLLLVLELRKIYDRTPMAQSYPPRKKEKRQQVVGKRQKWRGKKL